MRWSKPQIRSQPQIKASIHLLKLKDKSQLALESTTNPESTAKQSFNSSFKTEGKPQIALLHTTHTTHSRSIRELFFSSRFVAWHDTGPGVVARVGFFIANFIDCGHSWPDFTLYGRTPTWATWSLCTHSVVHHLCGGLPIHKAVAIVCFLTEILQDGPCAFWENFDQPISFVRTPSIVSVWI